MSATATARPWAIDSGHRHWIKQQNSNAEIAVCFGGTNQPDANAALIVAAVNAHDLAVKLAEAVLLRQSWTTENGFAQDYDILKENWELMIQLAREFQAATKGKP